jgi:chromosomal replication initiation ATPase DnaA
VLLERGTVYLEAQNRLAADRVRTLFRPLLEEILSADIGTQLVVELQANEPTASTRSRCRRSSPSSTTATAPRGWC